MTKMPDRLGLLATFARVAERGSISAAARDLGLSQASASRQLAALERLIGAVLVNRTTHSLALTEAGEACLREARSLLEGWEALVEAHGDAARTLRGPLKVVAPLALGQAHLAQAMLRFRRAHPEVVITWLLDDAPIRFAEIGCDLWLRIGRVPDERLIVRRLGTVERLIVADPETARGVDGPRDLEQRPCAAMEPFEGGVIPLTNDRDDVATVSARVALRTNNLVAAREAVRSGVAYAVMPRWFVAADLEAGRLIDVLPGWRAPALTVNAAFLPARRATRRLHAFLEEMARAVATLG